MEGLRHALNTREISTFDPRESTIQWAYGNYMTPEHTTARNESAALSETTAMYPIIGHRKRQPLPNHMLFLDEDGRPGRHWRR